MSYAQSVGAANTRREITSYIMSQISTINRTIATAASATEILSTIDSMFFILICENGGTGKTSGATEVSDQPIN